MSQLGANVTVRGEVSSTDDLSIEGRVDGPVWCEGHAVTIADTAVINGDVFARDITVAGTVNGTLLAREIVDVRASAQVTGRIVSARIILAEGGRFHGDVQPNQLDAALTVARHRRREAAESASRGGR